MAEAPAQQQQQLNQEKVDQLLNRNQKNDKNKSSNGNTKKWFLKFLYHLLCIGIWKEIIWKSLKLIFSSNEKTKKIENPSVTITTEYPKQQNSKLKTDELANDITEKINTQQQKDDLQTACNMAEQQGKSSLQASKDAKVSSPSLNPN